jgi:hypothetical protein
MIPFMMVLLLIIYFVFSDLVPILKKSQGKIFWIYSLLMALALVLNILILMNFKFPIISIAIKRFIGMFINVEA